jgi:hypothetical protein
MDGKFACQIDGWINSCNVTMPRIYPKSRQMFRGKMIELKAKQIEGKIIAEVIGGQLTSEADALDVVAGCGEVGTHLVLLRASDLSPAFFDLKTGLAGAALLKFSNYSLKVAAAIPAGQIPEGRFAEFAGETRKNREFRIFYDEVSAVNWLLAG